MGTITLILWLAGLASIPHVLFANKRPSSTLAWIWFIMLVPGLGVFAYWVMGSDRMTRRRVHRTSKAKFPQSLAKIELEQLVNPEEAQLVRWLSAINQIPYSTADEIKLLVNAREFFPALEEEVDLARRHVHIEFFIWRTDEIGGRLRDRLTECAKRGVEVRLLLDVIGCWGTKLEFFKELIDAGGEVAWFNPVASLKNFRFLNLRNHRKLQVIDGKIAFVGGMNIGREYLGLEERIGDWYDAQVRLTGQIVQHLQTVFGIDWLFATGKLIEERHFPDPDSPGVHVAQVINGGPDLPREPIPKTLLALLASAKQRVWISTGYFVPNTLFLTALQMCAARGVDVRLLVSAKTDRPYLVQVGRSFYQELLEWGVHVFEFRAGLNHKKAVLFDDDWMMIGSANSDNRSMRLNFELNVLINHPQESARLKQIFEDEMAVSREIHLKDFLNRPFKKRLVERAFRPMAPLL